MLKASFNWKRMSAIGGLGLSPDRTWVRSFLRRLPFGSHSLCEVLYAPEPLH